MDRLAIRSTQRIQEVPILNIFTLHIYDMVHSKQLPMLYKTLYEAWECCRSVEDIEKGEVDMRPFLTFILPSLQEMATTRRRPSCETKLNHNYPMTPTWGGELPGLFDAKVQEVNHTSLQGALAFFVIGYSTHALP